jgi:hypothetical protein
LILVKAQDAGAEKVFWLEPRLGSKTSRRRPEQFTRFCIAVCGNAVAGQQPRKITSAIVVTIIRNMIPENPEDQSGRRGASGTAAYGHKCSEPDNGVEIVPARPSLLLVA